VGLGTLKSLLISKNGHYSIHEVYYDDEAEPWTCTEDPVYPEGDTLEALCEEMEHYQHALELPVLEYADLVPDYDPSAADIEEPF
jgi:hypothetical protein